jgi:hypothetical protein
MVKKVDDRATMLAVNAARFASLLVGMFMTSHAGVVGVWAVIDMAHSS